MTIDEVLMYYRHKQSNVADALGVSRNTVSQWYRNNNIPLYRQREIELITKGALKADDKAKPRKNAKKVQT